MGDRFNLDPAPISHVTSPVVGGIAIDAFEVNSFFWNAEPVAITWYRRAVQDTDEMAIFGVTDEGEDRTFPVVTVNPEKSFRNVVPFPESWVLTIKVSQVDHESLKTLPHGICLEVPVQAGVVIPLIIGRQLRSHEKEFLARMSIHVSEQKTEVGEFLPFVAGHLSQQRAFSVNHLIVGKGHDEVLGVFVKHGEGHLVVMKTSVDRIFAEIEQGVVHPAHVPFKTETETAQVVG
jgi:phage terminase large subunit-like protein